MPPSPIDVSAYSVKCISWPAPPRRAREPVAEWRAGNMHAWGRKPVLPERREVTAGQRAVVSNRRAGSTRMPERREVTAGQRAVVSNRRAGSFGVPERREVTARGPRLARNRRAGSTRMPERLGVIMEPPRPAVRHENTPLRSRAAHSSNFLPPSSRAAANRAHVAPSRHFGCLFMQTYVCYHAARERGRRPPSPCRGRGGFPWIRLPGCSSRQPCSSWRFWPCALLLPESVRVGP